MFLFLFFARFMKNFNSKCLPTEFLTIAKLSQSGLDFEECQSQFNLTKSWEMRMNFTNDIQSCLKSCSINEFHGQVIYSQMENSSYLEWTTVETYFSVNELKIQEEYLVYSSVDLIGNIGGTLGLFLGYSFYDNLKIIFNFMKKFIIK